MLGFRVARPPLVLSLGLALALACNRPPSTAEAIPLGVLNAATLPDALVGASYDVQLVAEGGTPPYTWSLDVPTDLAWLSYDPATGQLSGLASAPLPGGRSFTVQVRDAAGATASRVVMLAVMACTDGATATCYGADLGACMQNSTTCSGGTFPLGCASTGATASQEPLHCGASCTACDTALADSCSGSCQCGTAPACTGGTSCCSANCVNLGSDTSNCGSCGHACPTSGLPTGAHPTCAAGACDSACDPGQTVCSGACTNLLTDGANCGACNNACSGPNGHCNGAGTCVADCLQGYTNCGGSCVVLATDAKNCGACGAACTAPSGGTASCAGSVCSQSCGSLTNCGGVCANTSTSIYNCGACGTVCSAANIHPSAHNTCSTGICGWACNGGYKLCHGACIPTTDTCDPLPCFVAGTPVTLADGTQVPIEAVPLGASVLALDPDTGLLSEGTVVTAFVHPDTPALLRINGRLTTTPEHRFYVDGRWVPAGELQPGDALLLATPRPDALVLASVVPPARELVETVERLPGGVTTYNLEVVPFHVYFAGGVLVHNIKQVPLADGPAQE